MQRPKDELVEGRIVTGRNEERREEKRKGSYCKEMKGVRGSADEDGK